MLKRVLGVCLAGVLLACATSPLGRRQLRLFPDEQMSQMGIAAPGQAARLLLSGNGRCG
jgi:hypothetical protein